jgi:Leucine Rich Repeat (LRR) protein
MRSRPSIASLSKRLTRYSLRTAIVFTTLVCIVLGAYVKRAHDEEHATDVVRSWGGTAILDYQWEQMNRSGTAAKAPPTPPCFQKLRQLLGDHYFSSVVAVKIPYHTTAPLNTNVLCLFHNLRSLDLSGTHVSDDDLQSLTRLKHIETLLLADTDVTNGAMRWVVDMPRLKRLSLQRTSITDVGLLALMQQHSLLQLDIDGTCVSRKAIEQFRLARPDCQVEVGMLATQTPLHW